LINTYGSLAMPEVHRFAVLSLLPILFAAWLHQINKTVTEPYLDEVFHVRQAQTYCDGDFRTWNPKITTPPGLYLLSYLFAKIKHFFLGGSGCDLANLRWLNSLVASLVIPVQVWELYGQLGGSVWRSSLHERHNLHTVINLSLFPLLFFFSGLHYTDVCSVSLVLGAYRYHLRYLRESSARVTTDAVMLVLLGLCALLMRQTNVFWVAVFPAGIHAVHLAKRMAQPDSDSQHETMIHDARVERAGLQGMMP
jgi:alpha-1,2-glucosyltransferase